MRKLTGSRRLGFILSVALVVAVAASVFVNISKVSATCGPAYCWTIVSSANSGTTQDSLQGIYVINSSTIWAVGYYIDSSSHLKTLIEKYVSTGSGEQFNTVTSVNPGTNNYLYGVASIRGTVTPADVWAVGKYTDSSGIHSLIEKYNGTSWSQVTPSTGADGVLNGVSGNSSSNYWAVGYYNAGTADKTLALRWNGTSWSKVTTPNSSSSATYLTSVSSVSNSLAWAAGYWVDSNSDKHPFLLKWDGSSWTDKTSDLGYGTNVGRLYGISFVNANEGYAVGQDSNGKSLAFLYSTPSNSWSEHDPYNGAVKDGAMYAVDYHGASSAWAVGAVSLSVLTSSYWDGSTWTHYTPAAGGALGGQLRGVSGLTANDTWAVGYSQDGSGNITTLVEHFN